jgi:tetrahydromethanopterin S-methyltransferase subunit G
MFAASSSTHFVARGFAKIEVTNQLVREISILSGLVFGILLLPHILAAVTLATNRTGLRILSAILLHTLICVGTLFGRWTYEVIDPTKVWMVVVAAFILTASTMAWTYRFNIGRGFLYAIIVNLLSVLIFRVIEPMAQSTMLAPYFGKEAVAEGKAGGGEGNGIQPVPPRTVQTFVSVKAAQAAAMHRYPDLGKSGSAFNQRFLEKHKRYQSERPDVLLSNEWPMLIAIEVANELGVP